MLYLPHAITFEDGEAERLAAPAHYSLPDGWTWEAVAVSRLTWNTRDRAYPVASAGGVVGWGTPLPPVHERPCAAHGLTSYRLRGPYGWVMIGATDHDDAMREAARSTDAPRREALEVWNGSAYVPAVDNDEEPGEDEWPGDLQGTTQAERDEIAARLSQLLES